MIAKPAPTPDAITAEYWQRLRDGSLSFQECLDCGARWLPPSPACPRCWRDRYKLVESCGRARLLTWAVYHRAYHPAFAESLPYVVGMVELDEGPRLLAGILTHDVAVLAAGTRLGLVLESREGGMRVPAFAVPDDEGGNPSGD